MVNYPFVIYDNNLKDKGAVFSSFGYERIAANNTIEITAAGVEAGGALCIAATKPILSVTHYKNGAKNGGLFDASAYDTNVVIIRGDTFISANGNFSVIVELAEAGYVYNVSLGKVLTIPEKIRGEYAPMRHNLRTEFSTQYSEAGIYLGRSEKRTGGESAVSFDRLPDSFINSAEFKAFAAWAKRNPYYFSPFSGALEMPEYHSYVQTETDLASRYVGNMRRMDLTLDMRKV